MSSPASKRMRLSASRTSLSGRKSITASSAPSRAVTNASVMQPSNRFNSTQPSYDFIGGTENEIEQPPHQQRSTSRPPSRTGSHPPPLKRTSLRQSSVFKTDAHSNTATTHQQPPEEILALRSKINSLDYELKNLQSERNLLALQHEKELREAQARADADYAKSQASETERLKAVRAAEIAQKEVKEVRDRVVNEKAALERKVRETQAKFDELVEEKEDVEGRFGEMQREYERFKVEEVDGKRGRLERMLNEAMNELESYKARCETAQKRLGERESEVERLEQQVLNLNGQAGGGEELDVLKREVGEQIAYARQLEGQVRDQNAELRKFRDERKSVNVVEEQKRALEIELQVLRETEKRVGELEIQREILEDEKRMWTSLLSQEGEEGQTEFESPEAVVKSLVNERIEHALLVDRLGNTESELSGKDEIIRALESERDSLKAEMEKAANATASSAMAGASDNKAYSRVERQRQLAVKEVENLRAQLKSLDVEETIMMENSKFDVQRSGQIKQLEELVDQYRSEIQTLHTDMSKLETAPQQPPSAAMDAATTLAPRGTKRPADSETPDGEDSDKSQLGPLLRKNKNLQIALQKTTSQSQQLATELQATKSQLKALRNSSKTRILELRENPTSQNEAVKMSTLRTLKQQNEDLTAQLRGADLSNVKVVPISSLDALQLDLQDKDLVIADKEKRMRRQREIWTDKAAEFRDVISSVLGYRINFMPNGKVKVSSLFYKPASAAGEHDGDHDNSDDPTNFIMFDGEHGTMKISGGSNGPFGAEVKELVDFWVKDRKEIPCFLAAMTLEFYEKFGSSNTIPPPTAEDEVALLDMQPVATGRTLRSRKK